MEASNWEEVQVINLKNNKIADIGTLPQFWPNLERLFAGEALLSHSLWN
jgi:hypothetical protein